MSETRLRRLNPLSSWLWGRRIASATLMGCAMCNYAMDDETRNKHDDCECRCHA